MNQARVINGPHIRTSNSTRKVMMERFHFTDTCTAGSYLLFWNPRAVSGRTFCQCVRCDRIFMAEDYKETNHSI